jgi:hypothetical protein
MITRPGKKLGRCKASSACVMLALLVLSSNGLAAQPDAEARALVVKVLASRSGAELYSTGSGIVVGTDQYAVYVVTARHVLDEALDSAGALVGRVRVAFAADSAIPEPELQALPKAGLVRLAERGSIDLAVMRVPRDGMSAEVVESFQFDRQGSAREGDRVYPVGCALEGIGCWEVPPLPDKVAVRTDDFLRFQTGVTAGGHSGGALFNQWGEVVGMITSVDRQFGTALSIDYVLSTLRSWDYRWYIKLRKSRVPRAGQRLQVGLTYLWAPGADPILSPDAIPLGATLPTRVPSSRLTVSWRLYASTNVLLNGHLAVLRLAPENLAIGAGFVGLQATLRTGPVAIGAFGEVGYGRVESQFDAGGHYIANPADGSDEYVPFWSQIKDDGGGTGFGGLLQLTLARFLIVEGTVGHWVFNIPENARNLPDLFVGGGVRIGG